MKKLLIVSQTYYPDSRATISILHRMAAGVAQKGVEVFALPLEELPGDRAYPPECDGVKILSIPKNKQETPGLKLLILLQKAVQKLLYAEKRLYTKKSSTRANRWNNRIEQIRQYQKKYWFNPLSERVRDLSFGLAIKAVAKNAGVDSLVSVSLPFWVHRATCQALSFLKNEPISWVPICFDPYAYTQNDKHVIKKKRVKEERAVYSRAHRILMLSQPAADYTESSLQRKIRCFEIPNLRDLSGYSNDSEAFFDRNAINCLFIGNLYWEVRNPEVMLRLFESFSNPRIRLHIVGTLLNDFPPQYMTNWIQRFGDRLTYRSRVSSETAFQMLNEADILVNIGNTTTNQCPSKVMEYISTGKPILHLSKISNCTSEVYLKDYPLAFLAHESTVLDKSARSAAEKFILEHNKTSLPYADVYSLYSNCTNEQAVDSILAAFQ